MRRGTVVACGVAALIGFGLGRVVDEPSRPTEICRAIHTSIASSNYLLAHDPAAPAAELGAQTVALQSLLPYCHGTP